MQIIAFIFARGGSKGLPGKNVRPLLGKPLIAWSIEQAFMVKMINRVVVSTDSQEIASVALKYGAEVPFMRPAELALDNSPEWLAWRHALNWFAAAEGNYPDLMISLPATAPLRSTNDIEACLNEYFKENTDIVITVTPARRNPYFNMVKPNADGTFGLVSPVKSAFARRQDVPEVFDMATVAYVTNPRYVLEHNSIFEGKVRAVIVPPERAIDIDTLLDFKYAETVLGMQSDET